VEHWDRHQIKERQGRDMKNRNKMIKTTGITVLAAAIMTLLIGVWGVTGDFDRWAQDTLYQQPKALDGEIIVIGIDDKTLDELGPYNNWDRTVMASALERLAADPEKKPAVVAIDTLYTGESTDEEDKRLADAAAKLGNVVTGSFASIGMGAVKGEDGKLHYESDVVYDYAGPYEALRDVTTQGHINAMVDNDGILRHALLYVKPDGGKVYSMAYTVASIYASANDMTVTEPETRNGFYYVPFSAKPGGYNDGYSLSDLINGNMDPEAYAGKIVFIGPYAVGLQDAFFTAIDRAEQMFGVEYQANVVQAVLEGNYKKEVTDLPQIILLFLICTAAFFVFQKTGFKLSTAVMVILILAGLGAGWLLYGMGYVVHVMWIPVGVLALYLVSIAIRYVKSVLEKQQVTRTFERYVAPEIVREIMKEGTDNLSLGGKLCDIAVLFVDVRGFTTMSERLDPEKVVYILNRYLTMASDCVERNKGTLDKFVGDAMMAFWGAPLPQDDAIYNAVHTAWDIVTGAAKVSDELKDEIGEELNVGVGVHFGPAVVGNMGAEKHMDYTAIGDTVNTSARLEANAPKGTVYISRVVADALEGRITYTSLGDTVKLKGKAEGFEVLKLESIS
jgi:adenylate cyclase